MSASAEYLRKLEKQRCQSACSTSAASNLESKRSSLLHSTKLRPSSSKQKQGRRLVSKSVLHGFVSKYQNRRSQILKSVNPFRSPINVSRVQTKDSVWVRGQRYRIYDIVAVNDSVSGKKYFGQVSTFLTDSYAQSYVILIWLVPKQGVFDRHAFDARNFVHGIAEERPIPVGSCEFLCSCPLIPRYMRPWSREQLMQEQIRSELARRVEEIRGTVKQMPASMREDFKGIS